MRVTSETITDEQIRVVWSFGTNAVTGRTLMVALSEPWPSGEYPTADEIRTARALCADAWNAHHGGAR